VDARRCHLLQRDHLPAQASVAAHAAGEKVALLGGEILIDEALRQ
jgi:hypothetical protein